MKKQEVPLRAFLESAPYEVLRASMQENLNHNNIMFNRGLKQGENYAKVYSNLINHNNMKKEFTHTPQEVEALREFKAMFKSKAFNVKHKIQQAREELKKQILGYAQDKNFNPQMNIIFKII